MAQIENQYSQIKQKIIDAFSANEMEIRKQKWQYALEKDYFTLTQDD